MGLGNIILVVLVTTLSVCIGCLHQYGRDYHLFYFVGYLVIQLLSFLLTYHGILSFRDYLLKADLFGYDINKKGTKEGEVKVPECGGIICATVYLVVMMVGLCLAKQTQQHLVQEEAFSLLTIAFIVLLGFGDDVFDLPWRYKLILPVVASLPILVSYSGPTTVLLPSSIPLSSQLVDIGLLYYVYMSMLIIFATNSINIYAGINGIEVGQSLIIGLAIVVHNVLEVCFSPDSQVVEAHQFSLLLVLPYLGTALALLIFNKFPSRLFVGDTFCYWSGTIFAVSGILGHFSKTLLLFFLPQIFNFVYSLPQLLGVVFCPRHRLPRFNQETGLLEASPNFTLINLALRILGPTSEKSLCSKLVLLQVASCCLGFCFRYGLSRMVYP